MDAMSTSRLPVVNAHKMTWTGNSSAQLQAICDGTGKNFQTYLLGYTLVQSATAGCTEMVRFCQGLLPYQLVTASWGMGGYPYLDWTSQPHYPRTGQPARGVRVEVRASALPHARARSLLQRAFGVMKAMVARDLLQSPGCRITPFLRMSSQRARRSGTSASPPGDILEPAEGEGSTNTTCARETNMVVRITGTDRQHKCQPPNQCPSPLARARLFHFSKTE